MEIRPFAFDDVPAFLALAAAEGWISDPWEFAFLLGSFPRGCLAVEEEGRSVAFVTAIRYGMSGWIGNLIVTKRARGRGYGTLLMGRAMDELLDDGVRTVWLTASAQGRPLYGKMGFREIDQVVRWSGIGREGESEGGGSLSFEEMIAMDQAGWGDDRKALLAATVSRGSLLCETDGFLVVQRCGCRFQFGPWSCGGRGDASILLDRGIRVTGEGNPVFVDVPARNGDAATLLAASGFSVTGATSLMFAGEAPAYDSSRIFALASMGGMG